ncbi:AI-2E family transporter [Swaminathania salitolerans]|nr:AI-2E family transporter [Swaminathania salitolerans]
MLRHSLSLRDVCVLIITLLALFYTLNCAADIVLPFVFAMVVNLLMIAPMRFLHGRLRLPKPIAALLLIIAMFVIVAGIGTAISVPAAAWLTKVPQSLPALQDKLAFLQGPIESLQRGYYRVISLVSSSSHHHVSAAAAASSSASNSAETLRLWGSSVLVGTRAFMGELFTMLLMLFFLMTEGDSLLRRIVEIMPTYSDKRRLVQITTQIERNVSLYLATITIMNLLVGLLNLLQCWLTGMPNPLLWGVLAFLLNYVPIIGPLTGVVVYFCVALISFPSFLLALLPPAIYLCIHIMEGETITPMLLAKRFTLNPVLVMASLLFWDWMWGIGGAFLSVPMLAVFKIFCDHIEALTPIGHVLGGPVRPRSLRTIGDPVSGSTANTAL